MFTKKLGDFTGTSTTGIQEAIEDALAKAGDHSRYEVIETTSSLGHQNGQQYQVTLSIFSD